MVLGITPNTKFVYSLKPPVELVVANLEDLKGGITN